MGGISSFREFPPRYKAALLAVAVLAIFFAGIGGAYAMKSSVSVEDSTLGGQGIELDLYRGEEPINEPMGIPKITYDPFWGAPSEGELDIEGYSMKANVSDVSDDGPGYSKVYLRVYAVFEGEAAAWVGIDNLTIAMEILNMNETYDFGTDTTEVPLGSHPLSGAVSRAIELQSGEKYDFIIHFKLNSSAGYSEAYDFSGMSFVFVIGTSDPLTASSE